MSSPHATLHDRLIEARGPDTLEERQEIRDEIRLTSLIMIAQELELLVNSLAPVIDLIDQSVRLITAQDNLFDQPPDS